MKHTAPPTLSGVPCFSLAVDVGALPGNAVCAQDEARRPADEREFAKYTLLFRAVREHALLLELEASEQVLHHWRFGRRDYLEVVEA